MLDAPTVERLPALEVRGETRGPRPAEVAKILARIGGPATSADAGDVASLREEDGSLVIVVRRASGEVIGEKRLPASLACAVRAEAAAVSIAALEGTLVGGEPALPIREGAPRTPPEAARSPGEATSLPATIQAPTSPAASVLAERAPPPIDVDDGVPADLFAAELGVAALASVRGLEAAPAGRLEGVVRQRSSAWAVGVAALAVGTHQLTVSPGAGTWWRWGGELTVRREARTVGGARLEARAGGALTALEVGGRSFSTNSSDTLFDPGLVLGARLVPFPGHSAKVWLDLEGYVWPRRRDLFVTGSGGEGSLPWGEVLFGVGVSFDSRR